MHVSSLLCVVAACPYLLCIILGGKLPHPQNMGMLTTRPVLPTTAVEVIL